MALDGQDQQEAISYLRFIASSFSHRRRGSTARDNLHAAAYVMGVFLMVRHSDHNGIVYRCAMIYRETLR